MAIWYYGAYLVQSVLMFMMIFLSNNYKQDLTVCSSPMLIAYLMLFLVPCTNFVISHITYKHITKNYQPLVTEYIYAKQTIKVKIVSFSASAPKACLCMIDFLHFMTAWIASGLVRENDAKYKTCKAEFGNSYNMGRMSVILGYLCVIRFLYLLFPHILGHVYFARKQR